MRSNETKLNTIVICNNCKWEGHEDELIEKNKKEYCPSCKKENKDDAPILFDKATR